MKRIMTMFAALIMGVAAFAQTQLVTWSSHVEKADGDVCTVVFTILSLFFPNVYYGFGFLLATLAFTIATALRLDYFTKRLPYYILSVQPLVAEDRSGFFTRMGLYLEEKFERR